MSDPFGWDYPAGAENDPDAPWNQRDESPDDERDEDDASDEECGDLSGNLTSPSALAAVHPAQPSPGMADLPSIAGFPGAGVSISVVTVTANEKPSRVGGSPEYSARVGPFKASDGILSGTSDLTTPSQAAATVRPEGPVTLHRSADGEVNFITPGRTL